MSKATKRKHVSKEVLDEFVLPQEGQQIVKVLAGRGNNLHEVETANGEIFLASMPTKFRKNVWIKRGDFVITEPIEEGDKVKAEIFSILYKDQIKHIKDNKLWPAPFDSQSETKKDSMIPDDLLPPSDDESDAENELVVVNVNRPQIYQSEDSDSEEDSEEELDEYEERTEQKSGST